ncbi:hypothetical protein BRARA_D00381 [Brassica rapa]|uniref:Uncharacterized protein n=1 Tax=Brassica campestris TaxID=3711 RepID=A0A397ZLE5_BRACM|nr:hypothetical protein BRARA_D00381 [Brassica rapa]
MLAPPVAAASSDINSPCLSAFERPMEKALVSESTLSHLFPNEFPYEFALTSPEDSAETEDEDDFLAGLTRRLALPSPPPIDEAKVNSTESTRSGNKSPNGPFSQALSPPETPCRKDDSVKVVSAPAGEVHKIKVDAKPNRRPPFPQNAAFYNYHYYYYYWLRQTQPALSTYQYPVGGVFAAPTAVKQPRVGTGVFTAPTAVAGTGVLTAPTAVKQPSVGTGVFLPRNCTNPSGSRKKAGKCVKLPTKVVQTEHPRTEKLSGGIQSRSQAHLSAGCSKLDPGTKSAVTGGCPKEESNLPQEWVY